MNLDDPVSIPLDASLDEVNDLCRELTSEDAAGRSATYVIKCRSMRYDKEELRRRASRWLESSVEVWMSKANDAAEVYYVGETGNVVERIVDHTWRQGAKCTKLFPPEALVHVEYYANKNEAQNNEELTADLVNLAVRNSESKDINNTVICYY